MRRTIFLSIGSTLLVSGCFKGPSLFKQSGGGAASGIELKLAEKDGVFEGMASSTSALIQVLAVSNPNNPIYGSSVSLPPGSLAIDSWIKIQEGASIASAQRLKNLGLSDPGKVTAAGPAVVITTSESINASSPFTLQIPISTSYGLDDPWQNLVIMYLVKDAVTNKMVTGIIPKSKITITNNTAVFSTTYFGSFQAVISSTLMREEMAAVTEEVMLTKQEEVALPPIVWALNTPFLGNRANEAKFPVKLTGAGELVSCSVSFYRDNGALIVTEFAETADEFKKVRVGTDATYTRKITEPHSVRAQFQCIEKSGRVLTSPMSAKYTFAAPSTNPQPTTPNVPGLNGSLNVAGVPEGYSNQAELSLTVSASSTNSTITHYLYKYGPSAATTCSDPQEYDNLSPIGSTFQVDQHSLSEGHVKLCVIGADSKGTMQSPELHASHEWILDRTAPGSPTLSPTNEFSNGSPVLLNLSGLDSDSAKIFIYENPTCSATETAWQAISSGTTLVSFNYAGPEGSGKNFYAKVKDHAGNSSGCAALLEPITIDRTPPTLSITFTTSPNFVGNVNYSITELPSIYVSAYDPLSGIASYQIDLIDVASTIVKKTYHFGPTLPSSPLSLPLLEGNDRLIDGAAYKFSVHVKDNANNVGSNYSTTWTAADKFSKSVRPSTASMAQSDAFGSALATNGTWMAASSPKKDNSPATGSLGAVYLYQHAGVWPGGNATKTLFSPDDTSLNFGTSLAMEGNILLVGAPDPAHVNYGKVYVFKYDAGTGNWDAHLTTPSFLGSSTSFGSKIAFSNNIAAIADGGTIHTYKYDAVADSWSPIESITTSWGIIYSLAISNSRLLAGGIDSVELYDFSNNSWTLDSTLPNPDTNPVSGFGKSVALSGKRMVVGADNAAYFYELDSSSIWQKIEINPSSPLLVDIGFGAAVAIDNNHIVIGADKAKLGVINGALHINESGLPTATSSSEGAAYVFKKVSAPDREWDLINILRSSQSPTSYEYFGSSVIIHEDHIGVAAKGSSSPSIAGFINIFSR